MTELINLWVPLLLFGLLATLSPGPNNLLLTLQGASMGFKSAVPFIMGIRVGIIALFVVMASGIAGLLVLEPNALVVMKFIGAAYMCWLAYTLIQNKQKQAITGPVNLSFWRGLVAQFVNPKSLLMVMTCISAFSLPTPLYWASVVQACVIFSLAGLCANIVWTLVGVWINRKLATEIAQQRFNHLLACLTILTVLMLFYD